MSSKGLKKPLEPTSLLDVQPVSDSDDDLSSPECLLLQPVGDDYSSDDEARKKSKRKVASADKFVKDKTIHASDVSVWEMVHYLKAEHELCDATQSMQEPTKERLVEESFRFLYPQGMPESFVEEYDLGKSSHKPCHKDWTTAAAEMCKRFFRKKEHQWFRENYQTDYTTTEGIISFFPQHDNEVFLNNWMKSRETAKASACLATRIHAVMTSVLEDEAKTTTDDGDTSQKHEKITGMLCAMMAYLQIPVLINSECGFHFNYNFALPGRHMGDVILRGKPDLTLCTTSWPQDPHVPFCTLQVYAPCDTKVLGRISEDSASHSQGYFSGKSQQQPTTTSANKTLMEENTEQFKSQPVGHNIRSAKTTMDKHKTDKSYATSALDTVAENLREQTIKHDKPVTSMKKEKSDCTISAGYTEVTVHLDKKYQSQLNAKARKNTPFAGAHFRDGDAAFRKIGAQLGLEMFGLLVNKVQQEQKTTDRLKMKQDLAGLGLFVMNDQIYLSQICYKPFYLSHLLEGKTLAPEIGSDSGPKYRYTNWHFSLKKPEDRLGFMIFLFHYCALMEKFNPIQLRQPLFDF